MKQPFKDLRFSSLSILLQLVDQTWAQKLMSQQPGIILNVCLNNNKKLESFINQYKRFLGVFTRQTSRARQRMSRAEIQRRQKAKRID